MSATETMTRGCNRQSSGCRPTAARAGTLEIVSGSSETSEPCRETGAGGGDTTRSFPTARANRRIASRQVHDGTQYPADRSTDPGGGHGVAKRETPSAIVLAARVAVLCGEGEDGATTDEGAAHNEPRPEVVSLPLGDTRYRQTWRFARSISDDTDGPEVRRSLRVGRRGRDHERYQCNAERSEHDGGQRAVVGNVQGA